VSKRPDFYTDFRSEGKLKKKCAKKDNPEKISFPKNPKSLVKMAEIFQKSETSRNSAKLTRKDVNITI
jgi:hypothetical protein